MIPKKKLIRFFFLVQIDFSRSCGAQCSLKEENIKEKWFFL